MRTHFSNIFLLLASVSCFIVSTQSTEDGRFVSRFKPSSCSYSPRCAERKAKIQEKLYSRYPCECTAQCHLYQNCCEDAKLSEPTTSAFTSESFSCTSLDPKRSGYEKIWMVTKCPETASAHLAARCDKTVSDAHYKYILDIPVISKKSNVVYANVFCAKCYNEHDYVRINATMQCNCEIKSNDYLKTMQYQKGSQTWTKPSMENLTCSEVNYTNYVECELDFLYPLHTGERCEANVISRCAHNGHKKGDHAMCSAYNYYVTDTNSNVYKNPHCALCNNIKNPEIACLPSVFPFVPVLRESSMGDVFHLSDLFSTNRKCSRDEVEDIVFGQCEKIAYAKEEDPGGAVSSVFYLILMSVSLFAMFLHMVIFMILFKKRNLHTNNLFCMVFSLFWAEILVLICSRTCNDKVGCYFSTMIVYYLFMTAFFWMNVMSYDICKTFHSTMIKDNSTRKFKKYALYAYGCPAVIALIALIVDLTALESKVNPGFGDNGFWFANRGGLLLFFVGPTEFLFLANMAMLVVSIYNIYQHHKHSRFARKSVSVSKNRGTKAEGSDLIDSKEKETSKFGQLHEKIKDSMAKMKENKDRLLLYTKLALIMGVPWFFAFFDHISIVFDYLFNILNSLQGLLIFISFDCKVKVWIDVCERFGWHKAAKSLASQNSILPSNSAVKKRDTLMTSTSIASHPTTFSNVHESDVSTEQSPITTDV